MKQILILTWFLFASANSQASTCEAAVLSSQHSVVFRQIQQLNPELSTAPQGDWAHLYVVLKSEEWKYGGETPLNETQKELIAKSQGAHYDFKDFTEAHYRQFYVNALRSLYVRVAAFWTAQELERLNGGKLDPNVQRVAARILEGTASPWNLKDRDLTPESARQYFKTQPWKALPWKNIFAFIEAWKKFSPYEFSHDKFSKFWSEQAENFGLEYQYFSPLQQAASGHEASLFCCLSEPGCNNCPHNRRWLK
jgi:hypothetical protein